MSAGTGASSSCPPRIVIVGGVAGGASAATRARRMNEHASIVLLEKDGHVSFANCGLPYYLGGEIADREALLVATPELFERRFRIDVRTHTEAVSIDRAAKVVRVVRRDTGERYELGYDKLILAPGASPVVPELRGVEASNVLTLRNLADADRVHDALASSSRVVVVGGGYIGLELVEQFVGRGHAVTLVELRGQVLPGMDPEMVEPITAALVARGVEVRLGVTVESVEMDDAGRAVGVTLSTGELVAADLVCLGVGVRPNVGLAVDAGLALGESGGVAVDRHGRTGDGDVYAVGDAAEYAYGPTGTRMRVPLAGPANRAGRLAGEHAATGSGAPMGDVQGTAIVRVFDQVAASTGLSAAGAARFGIEASSVTVIGKHHAGYFPGAQSITLKLVYAPGTGRVLGAQALGGPGVDKRVDVVATLMHFGGTVYDLAQLDLAYAPPFGSAKDVLHQAAFTACNALDGLVKVLQPDADLDGYQVVDVRGVEEALAAPLVGVPHAVNIPLDELRDRLGELDAGRPTVVSCASGQRSYLAARVLMQRGFCDVFNLTGAATMRRRALREHAAV